MKTCLEQNSCRRWYESLRIKMVIPLVAVGCILSLAGSWKLHQLQSREVDKQLINRAQSIVDGVTRIAEIVREPALIQRFVTARNSSSDVDLIVVAAGAPLRVVACSRIEWVGRPVSELPDLKRTAADIQKAVALNAPHSDLMHDDDGTIDYTAPLMILPAYGTDPDDVSSLGAVMLHMNDREARARLKTIAAINAAWLCGAIAAIGTLSFVLLHLLVLRPVSSMQKVILQNAMGDSTTRISILANDEMGQLGRILNRSLDLIHEREEDQCRTAEALMASHQETEAARASLEQVNAELAGKLQELDIARRAAEDANRTKSEFLANMSHEIRTPMTAILGFTDLLMDDGDLEMAPRRRVETIRTIQRNGEHLLALINDILDLSKIDAGRMTVEQIALQPISIVAEVLSLMRVRATEKNIGLDVDFVSAIPAVIYSDPVRLRQILVNLVGNAIKFTTFGRVSLEVSLVQATADDGRPSSRLRIAVRDTGIGMSPAQMGRLFQAFTQTDTSMTRRFGGTGLGLRISKRLAELLGGQITVDSTLGSGSCFTVEVATGAIENEPLIRPGDNCLLPQRKVAADVVASTATAELDEPATEPIASSRGSGSPASSTEDVVGCRLLLAEDGPDNQKLISFVLKKRGIKVTVVENGRLAIEALTQDGTVDGEFLDPPPFDVILMDMQMPEMDGYTAAGILKARNCPVPVIALTAHAMSGEREKCINAGCDDYATKPIDREVLLKTIDNWYARGKHPVVSEL